MLSRDEQESLTVNDRVSLSRSVPLSTSATLLDCNFFVRVLEGVEDMIPVHVGDGRWSVEDAVTERPGRDGVSDMSIEFEVDDVRQQCDVVCSSDSVDECSSVPEGEALETRVELREWRTAVRVAITELVAVRLGVGRVTDSERDDVRLWSLDRLLAGVISVVTVLVPDVLRDSE